MCDEGSEVSQSQTMKECGWKFLEGLEPGEVMVLWHGLIDILGSSLWPLGGDEVMWGREWKENRSQAVVVRPARELEYGVGVCRQGRKWRENWFC